MVVSDATPGSRFQFSLSQLFVWLTAVSVVCGLALAWINHVRSIEARDGLIPMGTANLTLFLAFAFLATLLGLTLGPLLCLLLSLCHSHRRSATCEKGTPDS